MKMCSEIEYVSTDWATVDDEEVIVLGIRPNPEESFDVNNLAISVHQAERLLDDLSRVLKKVDNPNPRDVKGEIEAFDNVLAGIPTGD